MPSAAVTQGWCILSVMLLFCLLMPQMHAYCPDWCLPASSMYM